MILLWMIKLEYTIKLNGKDVDVISNIVRLNVISSTLICLTELDIITIICNHGKLLPRTRMVLDRAKSVTIVTNRQRWDGVNMVLSHNVFMVLHRRSFPFTNLLSSSSKYYTCACMLLYHGVTSVVCSVVVTDWIATPLSQRFWVRAANDKRLNKGLAIRGDLWTATVYDFFAWFPRYL